MNKQPCKHDYAPSLDGQGRKQTALEQTVLRQGMSSHTFNRFVRIVKVKCLNCGKTTWVEERKLKRVTA